MNNLATKIRNQLLFVMRENTPFEYRDCDGYFFPFAFLMPIMELDREFVRGICRSLREDGLVHYGVGFNDDGEVNGAGYSLTYAGYAHLERLDTINDIRSTWNMCSHRVPPWPATDCVHVRLNAPVPLQDVGYVGVATPDKDCALDIVEFTFLPVHDPTRVVPQAAIYGELRGIKIQVSGPAWPEGEHG